jgi:hypothetical protein
MSVDLWWQHDEHSKYEYLHAGCCPNHIGWIERSSSGKTMLMVLDLPGVALRKSYLPPAEARVEMERAAGDWFDFACTNRPATEDAT